jgi:hypothetical protein
MKRFILLAMFTSLHPQYRPSTPTPVTSPVHLGHRPPPIVTLPTPPMLLSTPDPDCEDCKIKDRIILRQAHQIDILEEYIKRDNS